MNPQWNETNNFYSQRTRDQRAHKIWLEALQAAVVLRDANAAVLPRILCEGKALSVHTDDARGSQSVKLERKKFRLSTDWIPGLNNYSTYACGRKLRDDSSQLLLPDQSSQDGKNVSANRPVSGSLSDFLTMKATNPKLVVRTPTMPVRRRVAPRLPTSAAVGKYLSVAKDCEVPDTDAEHQKETTMVSPSPSSRVFLHKFKPSAKLKAEKKPVPVCKAETKGQQVDQVQLESGRIAKTTENEPETKIEAIEEETSSCAPQTLNDEASKMPSNQLKDLPLKIVQDSSILQQESAKETEFKPSVQVYNSTEKEFEVQSHQSKEFQVKAEDNTSSCFQQQGTVMAVGQVPTELIEVQKPTQEVPKVQINQLEKITSKVKESISQCTSQELTETPEDPEVPVDQLEEIASEDKESIPQCTPQDLTEKSDPASMKLAENQMPSEKVLEVPHDQSEETISKAEESISQCASEELTDKPGPVLTELDEVQKPEKQDMIKLGQSKTHLIAEESISKYSSQIRKEEPEVPSHQSDEAQSEETVSSSPLQSNQKPVTPDYIQETIKESTGIPSTLSNEFQLNTENNTSQSLPLNNVVESQGPSEKEPKNPISLPKESQLKEEENVVLSPPLQQYDELPKLEKEKTNSDSYVSKPSQADIRDPLKKPESQITEDKLELEQDPVQKTAIADSETHAEKIELLKPKESSSQSRRKKSFARIKHFFFPNKYPLPEEDVCDENPAQKEQLVQDEAVGHVLDEALATLDEKTIPTDQVQDLKVLQDEDVSSDHDDGSTSSQIQLQDGQQSDQTSPSLSQLIQDELSQGQSQHDPNQLCAQLYQLIKEEEQVKVQDQVTGSSCSPINEPAQAKQQANFQSQVSKTSVQEEPFVAVQASQCGTSGILAHTRAQMGRDQDSYSQYPNLPLVSSQCGTACVLEVLEPNEQMSSSASSDDFTPQLDAVASLQKQSLKCQSTDSFQSVDSISEEILTFSEQQPPPLPSKTQHRSPSPFYDVPRCQQDTTFTFLDHEPKKDEDQVDTTWQEIEAEPSSPEDVHQFDQVQVDQTLNATSDRVHLDSSENFQGQIDAALEEVEKPGPSEDELQFNFDQIVQLDDKPIEHVQIDQDQVEQQLEMAMLEEGASESPQTDGPQAEQEVRENNGTDSTQAHLGSGPTRVRKESKISSIVDFFNKPTMADNRPLKRRPESASVMVNRISYAANEIEIVKAEMVKEF